MNHTCQVCQGTGKLIHRELVLEGDYEITDEYLTREQDCYGCLGRGRVCNSCGGGGYYRILSGWSGYQVKTCEACKGDGYSPESAEDLKKLYAETQKINLPEERPE